MNEKLSALMDNELDELEMRRLLASLERDDTLRAAWGRYHLIGAALRREAPMPADVAARVAAQLASHPAPAGHARRPLTRFAGQVALAASVAAVAILGARLWLGGADEPVSPTARNDAAPVEYLRAGATRWDTTEREVESALNVYLVEHNEFAPAAGVSGMLPYGRVVGYDSPPRAAASDKPR